MNLNLNEIGLEEKRDLLKLLLDKERVQKARKIEDYKPHRGQLPFHQSQCRIKLCLGGNQVGKSLCGVVEGVWSALGIHPYRKVRVPNKGRIVASLGFEEGANQVIVPKLMEWMPPGSIARIKNNQAGIPTHYELANGSIINVLSGEQDKLVFEGWTGDWVHIDEPCKKEIYEACRRGLIKNNGHLWFTLTPLAEPWLYSDLYLPSVNGERKDIAVFTMDIMDNAMSNGGYLPDQAIKDFEADLTDDVKEARLHGKFRHLSGRIYPQFDKDLHIIEPFQIPMSWPTWEAIDPHLSKEHAWLQCALTPYDELIVCDEIWDKCTIPQLAEKILTRRISKNVIKTLIDTSSETPDSNYRITPRSLLRECGVDTALAHKQGGVDAGIHTMRHLLTPQKLHTGEVRPKFYVFNTCRRTISEFMNYVQDDRSTEYLVKDKPRKKYDDMMDLLRYLVIENPQFDYQAEIIRTTDFKYGEDGNPESPQDRYLARY